ncbi:MAG: L-proline glycine betaine binding transporter protein ProX [Actinomycetia bacterium]|nr:L-proline glycine betaine binding transporter protein ProX [Actinomycetes bacterium]
MKQRRPLLILLVALAVVAAACGSSKSSSTPSSSGATGASVPNGPQISIGAQNFGESAILSQVYGQALVAKGYKVKYQALGGFRDLVYKAFKAGDINFTPEYAASALEFLNKNAGEASPDAQATTAKLRTVLKPLKLQALDPSPAVDSNAFVVTQATATKYHLTNISDLKGQESKLTLGGPPDCPTNPFCIPGLKQRYGIDFSKHFKSLDAAGPITVQALKSDTVQVAVLFSTNGAIAANNWVQLKDDKGLINADAVVPVLTDGLVTAYGKNFTDLVNKVSAAMTTADLTAMNKSYDIDKEDAKTVATNFLTSKGLI